MGKKWVALALLAGSPALAQFANKSLGLTAGGLELTGTSDDTLSWGAPIGLCGSLYLENGFELVGQLGIIVAGDRNTGQNVVVLDGPSVGIRYLFREESVRPFVGLDASYLHIYGTSLATVDFAGLGPNVGVDVFVADSISIGVRARFNLYLSLNPPLWTSWGLSGNVSTYF